MSLCNNHIGEFTVSYKVCNLQKQRVSVMKRLKRKTKHGSQALLRGCVRVTSPIRITDRLNHSESNVDLHKSEY